MSTILYRGGSGFGGIKLLGRESIHVFHFNDYPADPPREKATDADRVYPGDGVAPLKGLIRDLAAGGFHVTLSLELFNRKLWSQDPLTVVQTGLEKMKALVQGEAAAARLNTGITAREKAWSRIVLPRRIRSTFYS